MLTERHVKIRVSLPQAKELPEDEKWVWNTPLPPRPRKEATLLAP